MIIFVSSASGNRQTAARRGPMAAQRGTWIALAGIAIAAALLHVGNLVFLSSERGCDLRTFACPPQHDPFVAPDTAGYLHAMRELREQGIFGVSTIKRPPGYPALLLVAEDLTGSPRNVLWLSAVFAGLAAAAISWLVLRASGRLSLAIVAGVAFCWWPNALQFSPMLLTDGIHGFAAVAAVAATLCWRDSESGPAAALAGALWLLVQSLRLTFFWLPAVLPLLLVKRGASRFYRRGSVALWAIGFLMPGFLLTSNWLHHGAATLSEIPARNLACYSVPRLQAELGQGDFYPLRRDCIRRYRHLEPAARIAAQEHAAVRFLLAHPGRALSSFMGEVVRQLTHSMRPYYKVDLRPLYRDWPVPGKWFLPAFWAAAAIGLLIWARTAPLEAAFLGLVFVGVILPAATSHLVGGRLRFPLDLMFLPVVVAIANRFVRSRE